MAQTKQVKNGQTGCVIFIVEDEDIVRILMRKLLQSEGHHVLEAANGTTAQNIWKTQKERIDLAILDMVMPDGFTGTKMAKEFRRDKPGLPIIFSSGYDLGDLSSDIADAKWLQKPFDVGDLLKLVQSTLDKM